MRIATALSTTIAELLSLPTVQFQNTPVEIPPALLEFRDRMAMQNSPLSGEDLRDLATMKFRGGQPQSADEWQQLYLFLNASTRKKKS